MPFPKIFSESYEKFRIGCSLRQSRLNRRARAADENLACTTSIGLFGYVPPPTRWYDPHPFFRHLYVFCRHQGNESCSWNISVLAKRHATAKLLTFRFFCKKLCQHSTISWMHSVFALFEMTNKCWAKTSSFPRKIGTF